MLSCSTTIVKNLVRARMLEVRAGLPAAQSKAAGRDIAYRLIGLDPFLSATSILTYAPHQGEVSPEYALELREAILGPNSTIIAYPRVLDEGTKDEHHEEACLLEARIARKDELESGFCGVREPSYAHELLAPDTIDVVLVPGVAFDIRGGRIGFGKGYYDRFLQQLPPHTVLIGLSYDETVTDFVPRDYHDVGMDYVVTPSTTYDFKSRHPRR